MTYIVGDHRDAFFISCVTWALQFRLDDIREVLQTEFRKLRVRESKNNGASFRKSVRTFGSTGLEPNKIFGSVLRSVTYI